MSQNWKLSCHNDVIPYSNITIQIPFWLLRKRGKENLIFRFLCFDAQVIVIPLILTENVSRSFLEERLSNQHYVDHVAHCSYIIWNKVLILVFELSFDFPL